MMHDVEAKARTQAERSEESAQRILEAAVELIAEQGFRNTTTAQISKRAGFSNAMVHVRYGSKESLLVHLLELYEQRLLVDPAPEATGLEAILSQIDTFVDLVRERPGFLLAFCVLCFETVGPMEELRAWNLGWRSRYVAHTTRVLQAGREDGSVRADINAETEAYTFLDFATGLSFRWTLDPDGVDMAGELALWRERLAYWLG